MANKWCHVAHSSWSDWKNDLLPTSKPDLDPELGSRVLT